MLAFPSNPSTVSSHHALVDSGASIHILTCHTFLSDAVVNHSAVASFAGSTSRATHKGTFAALVQCTNNRFHRLVQKNSALVVPDASRMLFSISQALAAGHHVHFGNSPGLLLKDTKAFIPFVRDTHTGMYLLPLVPPLSRHNGTYPLQAMRAAVPAISIPNPSRILPAIPITQYQPSDITLHNTLGHIAHRRSQQLDVGIPQPSGKKVTCPICITAKARRTARPLPSDVTKRAQHPWQDVSVDLSGKMRIQGISNVYYYIPFVCNYSGAKMVEFVQRKSHFIHAYRRFVARLEGVHPRKLRTDKGGEFMSHELKELLELNYVHHQTCAVDEHYSIGTSENAVGRLRETALTLLLQANLPAKFWPCAIQHSVFLSNYTSRSRANPKLTVYELLFQRKADLSKVPPFGAYCTVFRARDQRQGNLDLPSSPGIFIGVGIYQKTLGYMVTDVSLNKITVTRQHLSFDPQLFPLRLKPDAPPLFRNYHKLTTPAPTTPDSTPPTHPFLLEEQESSDFEPDDKASAETPTTEPKETNKRKRTDDESESSESDSDIITTSTRTLRPRTPKPTVPKPTKPTPRYDTDEAFRNERNSMIGKRVTKYFPGHGAFKGTVQEYAIKTDNYLVVYDDGDQETIRYRDLSQYLPGHPDFISTQANFIALSACLAQEIEDARYNNAYSYYHANAATEPLEPNSWREMRKTTHAAKWQIACDEEMESLRNLNCWQVVPLSSVPPGTPIMGSRWTFKAKTDQHGEITRLRARFVCQGFSQVKDVSYWESFSPVVSFTTIRLLIALTALPHWHAIHYDVSVAFITAEIDPTQPPIYCRPAEGYESRTESVYLLKRYLYGMKDSPRGYNLHFNSVCLNFGLKRCISDECVYIKVESNDHRNKETPTASLDVLTSQTTCIAPEHRIHKDCHYALRILIVSTYVDDNLIFTNSRTFADEFATHCNKSLKMNLEGDLTWYLSVLYTRCPITGKVTASQERYIDKLLQQHGMQNCNPVAVPFPAKCDDILAQLATPIENPDPKLVKEFQTLCGGLLYLQVHTCPEISFVVSLLSRHMTKAGELHIALAKKVLRYLQSRKHLYLSWSAQSCTPPHVPGEIYGWSDASFADIKSHDNTHRASSIGWLFMCNNGPISWRSTKTPLIALNVAESEMIALSSASQEAIFLRKLANELGFIQTHPTIIYEDCESAVALSKENRFRKRSKHIDVRWSFIVEKQRHGDLRVISVSRTIMLADILCSPRAAATFSTFRNKILGYQTPPTATGNGVASITDAPGRIDDRSAKASSTAHKDSGDGSHK